MSLAYHDTITATTWAASVVTDPGIGVSVGDLVVILWGGQDSTYLPTTCSDSLGNTYTLRTARDSTNDSTMRIGWCVSAFDGSATFTGNVAGAQRCFITVVTYTVDAGDTISVDSYGTLTSAWAESPFITSEFNITETDCVAVAAFSAMLSPTWSNKEIPNGTAASEITSYASFPVFYQLFTSTATGVEAAVDSSASAGVVAECVVFKSVAAAGGGVNLSIFDRHYRGLMAA
jgi:hypothetical protein